MNKADLPAWPSFYQKIEPLPGGLRDLNRRIRDESSPRALASSRWTLFLGAATATCGLLLLLLLPHGPSRAAHRLFDLHQNGLPPPEAVALGLASKPNLERIADPRLPPSDEVIFFWVANASPD